MHLTLTWWGNHGFDREGIFLMSNIKFETLTQRWGNATLRCKTLISNNLDHAAHIASQRRCRHWFRGRVNLSHFLRLKNHIGVSTLGAYEHKKKGEMNETVEVWLWSKRGWWEVSASINSAMFCNVLIVCVALMAFAHLHQIKRHYLVIPFRD